MTIAKLCRDTRGNALVILGLSLPVLFGAIGLGTEAALWSVTQGKLQDAADSGALSAARAVLKDSYSDINAQVEAVTAAYGYTSADGAAISVNKPPSSGPYTGDSDYIEVIISTSFSRSFSNLFGSGDVPITARSVSRVIRKFDPCLVTLNPSADKSINLTGGSVVSVEQCDIVVHSTSTKSVVGSGGAMLSGQNFYSRGGASLSGGSQIDSVEDTVFYTDVPDDPYADVPLPPYSGCDYSSFQTGSSVTLSPGVYCGGISASGGDLTLEPGIYFIDGGDFIMSGGGTVEGDGVTLVFTSSSGREWPQVKFTGGSSLDIFAPTSGPTAGFAIYGDRNMPRGTKYEFTGGGAMNVNGVAYLPKAQLKWTGGSTLTSNCTKLVADKIELSGNSMFAGECDAYPSLSGSESVMLVE